MLFNIVFFQYGNEFKTNGIYEFSFIFDDKVLIAPFDLKIVAFRINFLFFTNIRY